MASYAGNAALLDELFRRDRIDANLMSNLHRTPLHEACSNGNKSSAVGSRLMQLGASIHATESGQGWTPLHFAGFFCNSLLWLVLLSWWWCAWQCYDVASTGGHILLEELLQRGANINVVYKVMLSNFCAFFFAFIVYSFLSGERTSTIFEYTFVLTVNSFDLYSLRTQPFIYRPPKATK